VEDLQVLFEPLPNEELVRFPTENIVYVNIATAGVGAWHPVGFFLRNTRGEWLGGLTGYIWGGWLHVHVLCGSSSRCAVRVTARACRMRRSIWRLNAAPAGQLSNA
jgi:hypothetical protein